MGYVFPVPWPYALGIDVGVAHTVAAICQLDGPHPGERAAARPIRLKRGGGEDPHAGASIAGASVIDRVGDAVPIIWEDTAYAAHELVAALIVRLAGQLAAARGAAEQVVVTHPPAWGPYRLDLLHQALHAEGLANVVLVPEPVAAAVGIATRHRLDGDTLAVYDLGEGSARATVLRANGAGFEILGRPAAAAQPAGADFDDVLISLLTGNEPARRWEEMARLRGECAVGKRALSTRAEITVPPGNARVTRASFEEAILPDVQRGVEVLLRAIAGADTGPDQLAAIALVGGSARIPLVRKVIGERLRRPVLVDDAPETTTAVGAATIAAGLVRARGDQAAAMERTGPLARLTAPTVIDGPGEPAPDQPPARPPVKVGAPAVDGVAKSKTRRADRAMTIRGTILGGIIALLLAAGTWLVQQHFFGPSTPPPVTTSNGTGHR